MDQKLAVLKTIVSIGIERCNVNGGHYTLPKRFNSVLGKSGCFY